MSSTNGYPFVTKNEVTKRIASEPTFVLECIRILDGKWMASHKVRAGKIVARVAAGELLPEDLVEAIALVTPYARTLSRILRDRQIAEGSPELAAQAAVFGVVRPTVATEAARAVEAVPASVVNTAATEAPAVPTKRRRGRPKGSRNRVKTDVPMPKRRRQPS